MSILSYNFFDGRINRKKFLLGFFISIVIFVFLYWREISYPSSIERLIHLMVAFLTMLFIFSIIIKRLRDSGLSVLWILVLVIPWLPYAISMFYPFLYFFVFLPYVLIPVTVSTLFILALFLKGSTQGLD